MTLALATLVAGASSAAARAASLGGFSVRPLQFNPSDPTTRAYFKQTVPAGGRFHGDVVVTNPGPTPIELFVYPVDGLTGTTTGSVYGDHRDPLRKAGRWLAPGVSEITVAPRARRTVAFTVRVPAHPVPGDHLAGLAFESAHPRHARGRFSVTEILRVVVGVEIRVPGPAHARLHLRSASLRPLPGTPVGSVVISMADTGRLLCQPDLRVTLARGGSLRTVVRQLRTVLPGDAIAYPFAWPTAISAGVYRVSVLATGCGRPVSLTRTVRSGRPLAGAQHWSGPVNEPAPAAGTPVWVLSLIGVGGLLGGITVAGGAWAIRRRPPTVA